MLPLAIPNLDLMWPRKIECLWNFPPYILAVEYGILQILVSSPHIAPEFFLFFWGGGLTKELVRSITLEARSLLQPEILLKTWPRFYSLVCMLTLYMIACIKYINKFTLNILYLFPYLSLDLIYTINKNIFWCM